MIEPKTKMKKLMKAVAFAVVMCMLLSTVAFASDFGTANGDKETKIITANVLGAGANEQVVLLIVNADVAVADATEAEIMYIDQKQADASGAAAFSNILIKDTEQKVDIYVGSAATNGPQLIGEDVDVSDVKNITLATGVEAIITATALGEGEVKKGFAAAITVDIPETLAVSKMIWGFKLAGEENRRYSAPQIVGGNTTGRVQFAAAFGLGFAVEELEVEDVSAIFLTTDGRDHYTNEEADAPNKKTN
jgi:hypothetical protein